MIKTYAPRKCRICGKEYAPAGPRQQFCPERKTSATASGANALRLAIVKQAKKDGKLERMIETGAAQKLFPETDPDYLRRLVREAKECTTRTTPEEISTGGTETRNEPSKGSPSANAADSRSSRETPSASPGTGSVTTVSTDSGKPLRRSDMKHFEPLIKDEVLDALKAGNEVKCVDLAHDNMYNLERCTVAAVFGILGREDVVFWKRKEARDGDAV